jgi:hypothetical protein
MGRPSQLSHCVTTANIPAAVRLVFRSYQFHISRYDEGYVRGCIIRRLSFSVPAHFVVTTLVTDDEVPCHKLYHPGTLSPTAHTYQYRYCYS